MALQVDLVCEDERQRDLNAWYIWSLGLYFLPQISLQRVDVRTAYMPLRSADAAQGGDCATTLYSLG